MEIQGIVVELPGIGYCYWLTRQSGSTYIRYETSESYVNLRQILAGDLSQTFQAPAGRKTFQFNFMLPASLPSSFESNLQPTQAHIRYSLSARVDNESVTYPITIQDLIDTNNHNYLQRQEG